MLCDMLHPTMILKCSLFSSYLALFGYKYFVTIGESISIINYPAFGKYVLLQVSGIQVSTMIADS